MKLHDLIRPYTRHSSVVALAAAVRQGKSETIFAEGLRASAAPLVMAALAESKGCALPYLVVSGDEEEAGYFYHDLMQILGPEKVHFFPSGYRRAAKYARRDAANEILRTGVLATLAEHGKTDAGKEADGALFVVTYPEALAEKVASRAEMADRTLRLVRGTQHDLTALEASLRDLGFLSRDYVYEPGEFAVRGSILDIYSYASEYPYRIDFFGDEIDSIRTFEIQTQLSREPLQEVSIVPELESNGERMATLCDFLPDATRLVVRNLALVRDTADRIFREGFARQAEIEQEQTFDKTRLLADSATLMDGLATRQRIEIGTRPTTPDKAVTVRFRINPQPIFHKNFDLVCETFSALRDAGKKICVLSDSAKQTERLAAIFAEQGGGIRFTAVERTLHAGFEDEDLGLCLFTDHQIFDRFHKYDLRSDHVRSTKIARSLKELTQFEAGDYVVHTDHGIGRFAGLVRMPTAGGEMQEVIKLTYQNDDVVFVSIHSLHKVSKYKSREGEAPRMSRLGTGAWERVKERTKSKIKDIARDLIRLYATRREQPGFRFSADNFMQQQLEASFAYEDTPDQLRVTQEVKADMERARPMDRLICGDVGFGKTEIAVRAAFKAVCDNKQVVVLVPTTVLAHQHYRTFARRLKDFPVRVDYLSRARTAAAEREVLRGLEDGSLNIVVGTQKLIGRSVKFRDLGLLIIDEEQKFGVAVKERLRQMKANIDTLTMSATPIPRTLQFSLMGARDLSVIRTPPQGRYPIRTEVHTFSAEIIADAVGFEMSRNGQTYIVSNRIAALPSLANLVKKHVPDARVAIGHGQMPPSELERIVLGFVDHDYDVLIATTIVENGIDIPNANTIIIDAAHHFGLSDLHQMRGRVGRGGRKAFCYLLAPPLALLPADSRRRLEAIENFSDLGSGIHIAMQDLDIRGAGNLLGAEQSGFIADLGYETYQKILGEALAELRSDEFADLFTGQADELRGEDFVDECTLESDLMAYFPETYVPGATERILLYRELDGLERDDEIAAFRSRMEDRFGPLPPEGEELLRVVPLRRLARHYGAERLTLRQGRMTLYFVSHAESPFYRSAAFDAVLRFAAREFRRCRLDESHGRRRMQISGVDSVERALAVLASIEPSEA